MKNTIGNNLKLGILVLTSLLILVVSLYMVGKNNNLFGSNVTLKARFRDVAGLMPGNNVRFSGIQCGTVKSIAILNDTTIEVVLVVESEVSRYIKENAAATIGTEGLMGNRVINITPGSGEAPSVKDGGVLTVSKENGLDDVMTSIAATGDNVLTISADLQQTADRINRSEMVRHLLADTSIPANLHQTLINFNRASDEIRHAAAALNALVKDVQQGRGVAGVLLSDPSAAREVSESISNINAASVKAAGLVNSLDSITISLKGDLQSGAGPLQTLLRDSSSSRKLVNSIENLENGTRAFNEDMEALKHNFLLRGYFRKKEKKK